MKGGKIMVLLAAACLCSCASSKAKGSGSVDKKEQIPEIPANGYYNVRFGSFEEFANYDPKNYPPDVSTKQPYVPRDDAAEAQDAAVSLDSASSPAVDEGVVRESADAAGAQAADASK